VDPRIARTRGSLQQALLELARERPLETITVADIAERAGVNRSSFYQHYSDKETLLADALDVAAEEAAGRLPAFEGIPEGPPAALVAYLAYVDANAELYRRALGEQGSAVVTARMRDSIETVVRDAVTASGIPGLDGLPVDVVAAGITGSALGVVRAWLARDPRPSVATAAEWVWKMLLGPAGARHRDG
jgi:AcrR family transcriptional regulator